MTSEPPLYIGTLSCTRLRQCCPYWGAMAHAFFVGGAHAGASLPPCYVPSPQLGRSCMIAGRELTMKGMMGFFSSMLYSFCVFFLCLLAALSAGPACLHTQM